MTAAFAPAIGEPPSIQLIPPARLMIDPSYQRTIETTTSRNLIARIAAAWDWRLCVPLLASRRADGLYVIDGQHRLEGARRRGDITYLPVCVSEYGSVAEEAQTFVDANRRRRAVIRVDTFRAQLLAGDASAVELAALLDGAGLALAKGSGAKNLRPGELNCVTALERARTQHGAERLAAALDLIAGAFRGEPLAAAAALVHALCQLLQAGHKKTAIALTLRRWTLEEWTVRARAHVTSLGGQSAIYGLRKAIAAELAAPTSPAAPLAPPPAPRPAAPVAAPPAAAPVSKAMAAYPMQPAPPRPRKAPMTLEQQLEAQRNGAKFVEVAPMPSRAGYDGTLGGVGSGML